MTLLERMLRITVIGDFDKKRVSHIATHEALRHAAEATSLSLDIQWIATQALENNFESQGLESFDGIWGAPGVPKSSSGVMNAIRFAREKGVPYVGT